MALAKGVNSYATVAEADARIIALNAHDGTWGGLEVATKEAHLQLATRLVDDHFAWTGWATDEDQPLEWPRQGVVHRRGWSAIDDDETPREIGWAVIEMARQLAQKDRTKDDAVETIGIAGASGTTFTGRGGHKVIPDAVYYLVPDCYHAGLRRRTAPGQEIRMAGASRG